MPDVLLRAAGETHFTIIVYCFMPDHVHLLVEGLDDASNLKQFAASAKQCSGYYSAREHGRAKLWQHGKHDHSVRDQVDLLDRVRYVVNNPVVAGFVTRPEDYPFVGSQRWTLEKLIEWCRPRIGESPSNDGR